DRLPLKANDWNTMHVSLKGDKVLLELNGVPVFERALEPNNDRLFGFFHYKDRTGVQVRNVVLRGDWPEKLTPEVLSDLTALVNPKSTDAERRARTAVIGEEFSARTAADVLRSAALAAKADAAAAMAQLKDWVLPNGEHSFRLYGAFEPTNPAVAAGQQAQNGGNLMAPALELVAAARRQRKLDELSSAVERATAPNDHDKRCQLALLAMVRAAQERDDDAAAALQHFVPLLSKLPEEAPEYERWPEVIAAAYCLNRPKLHASVMALLDYIVVQQLQKPETKMVRSPTWERHVRRSRARGQMAGVPEFAGKPPAGDPLAVCRVPGTHA